MFARIIVLATLLVAQLGAQISGPGFVPRQQLGAGIRIDRGDHAGFLRGLSAWYDVSDAASLMVDSSLRVSLWADKSGNSAINALCLNGALNNYASAPDSVALSITGDIDIAIRLSTPIWTTPAATYRLLTKRASATLVSYDLALTNTGALQFITSVDGSTLRSAGSSASVAFSNFAIGWVRVTRASASGDTIFYTAPDSSTYPTVWTQLGTTQSTTAGAIFDGTQAVEIGSTNIGTAANLLGNVYRAQIRNGIAGTLVFDANFTAVAKLATSFTESSANAATVTINTSGDTGARISGERDLYQGTVTKQPVYLAWAGANYGFFNGVGGNYGSTPDANVLDLQNDMQFDFRGTMRDLTQTGCILAKRTAGQWSYQFVLSPGTSQMQLAVTTDGSTALTYNSTAWPALSANVVYWFRWNRRKSDGRVQFFYQADTGSNAVPSSGWTQVGADVTGTTSSLFSGTAGVEVGSNRAGTGNAYNGLIYRAVLYSDLGATIVFDFDPSRYTSGTTFSEGSANAATVTLNGGATIVTRTGLYLDGSDDYMRTAGFSLPQPVTNYYVGTQVSWTGSDIIVTGASTANSMDFQQFGVTPEVIVYAAGANTGTKVSFPLQTRGILTGVFNGASSSIRLNRNAIVAAAGNIGTTAPNGLTLAANPSPNQFGNILVSELATYSVSHSSSEQDAFATSRMFKWRIP